MYIFTNVIKYAVMVKIKIAKKLKNTGYVILTVSNSSMYIIIVGLYGQ